MSNPSTETKTWVTVATIDSPRPPSPDDNAVPSLTSDGHVGKPTVSEEQKKSMQDELLLGIGAQFGTGEHKSASG
ncbi:hypothetical protein ACHAPT_007338 [Fusarium lateritium]